MDSESGTFDARLKLPFSMIVAGAPCSGKTSFVRRLLEERYRLIDKTIDRVVWFYGQETEFVRKMGTKLYGLSIHCVKGLPNDFDEYIERDKKVLFVIDDLMQTAGDSSAVTDLFCNKLQHSSLSVILLLQNPFYHGKERSTFLRCTQYLVIFRNPMDKSIPLYLAQKLMPLNRSLFMNMFDTATATPHSYLFCDGTQDTPDLARFRTDIFDGGVQKVYVINKHEHKKSKK